jgi:hypothetical protein
MEVAGRGSYCGKLIQRLSRMSTLSSRFVVIKPSTLTDKADGCFLAGTTRIHVGNQLANLQVTDKFLSLETE